MRTTQCNYLPLLLNKCFSYQISKNDAYLVNSSLSNLKKKKILNVLGKILPKDKTIQKTVTAKPGNTSGQQST